MQRENDSDFYQVRRYEVQICMLALFGLCISYCNWETKIQISDPQERLDEGLWDPIRCLSLSVTLVNIYIMIKRFNFKQEVIRKDQNKVLHQEVHKDIKMVHSSEEQGYNKVY